MEMDKVYAMKSAAIVEIKVRECALTKKAKITNQNIKKMKLAVQDVE